MSDITKEEVEQVLTGLKTQTQDLTVKLVAVLEEVPTNQLVKFLALQGLTVAHGQAIVREFPELLDYLSGVAEEAKKAIDLDGLTTPQALV